MRPYEDINQWLLNHPDDQDEFNRNLHKVFSVCNKIGCSPGQLISFILDKNGISSIFYPFKK